MKHYILQKSLRLLSGMLLVAVILFVDSHESECKIQKCLVKFTNSKGGQIKLNVEVAATEQARQKGLMYRMSLPENDGMLFIFEKDKRLSFWMKNTYIPLDIAYLSKNGIINEIQSMMPLDVSLTYPSKKPAKYALEVNSGWFKRNGIRPGMKLDFNGCLGK